MLGFKDKPQPNSADNRNDVKDCASAGWNAKDTSGIEHSHNYRCQGDKNNEWKENPGKIHGQIKFTRNLIETMAGDSHQKGSRDDSQKRNNSYDDEER